MPIDRAFLSPRSLKELPGKEILAEADPVLERLSREVERAAAAIEDALKRADQGIHGIRGRWSERQREVEAQYERILRELQKSSVDGAEFIRLRQEIERLSPLRERRALLERLEKKESDRRVALLVEWEEVKAAQFRLLDRAAKAVSQKLREQVQVTVTAAGNREPLFEVLRATIGGRLSETIEQLKRTPDLSLPQFVGKCRNSSAAVQRAYFIPPGPGGSPEECYA